MVAKLLFQARGGKEGMDINYLNEAKDSGTNHNLHIYKLRVQPFDSPYMYSPNKFHQYKPNGNDHLRAANETPVRKKRPWTTYQTRNKACGNAILQKVDISEVRLTQFVLLCRTASRQISARMERTGAVKNRRMAWRMDAARMRPRQRGGEQGTHASICTHARA